MRYLYLLVALPLLAGPVPPAAAEVSVDVGVSLPGVQIGVNLADFPDLQPVPGYPVYYAPGVNGNYFFYDGMYWVYVDDTWYSSSWYNGPWFAVAPEEVPLFVLRVPVRYYRVQPAYFRGWRPDAPPRWDAHWGPRWVERHRDWDRWDRRQAPPPAPLPTYQRDYAGSRYPSANQQREIRVEHYHFQPHDPQVRQRFVAERAAAAKAPPASATPREPAQTVEQQRAQQAEQQRAQQAQAQQQQRGEQQQSTRQAEQQRAQQAQAQQQQRAEQQQHAQQAEQQRAQQAQAQQQQRAEQQQHAQQAEQQQRAQQAEQQRSQQAQQRQQQQRAQPPGAQQREEQQQRRDEKGKERRPGEGDNRGN
jgi:hypothetical protein